MTTPIPATLIPGDGIGPEIVDATLAALDALQAPFEWDRQIAGLEGVKQAGDPLPQATLDSIRRTRLALKGPLETPSGAGYRSSNVRLREAFNLYANLRPAKTIIPGGRFDKIDLVVVRENLEGLYIGHEHYVQIDDDPHAVAIATGINTRAGGRRLLEFAFDHAVATGRKKVTIVHKANIMKALTGIFLEEGEALYERKYKGQFELETVIIDACAMKLVLNPGNSTCWSPPTSLATSSRTWSPAWWAAWAWRRAPTSAQTPRSSKRCTAQRRTSRAKASPTPQPCCSPPR